MSVQIWKSSQKARDRIMEVVRSINSNSSVPPAFLDALGKMLDEEWAKQGQVADVPAVPPTKVKFREFL